MPRLRLLFTALLIACLASLGARARAADSAAELMAAYLFNFARFVEWPAAQFPSDKTPLVLCTPDADALDGHLLRIHGRQAQGRRLVVRLVDSSDHLTGCHLLFLPKDDPVRLATLLATAVGKPVLTVSDLPGFTAQGGIIALFVAADRVQFDINREIARQQGLRISSRLLALARTTAGDAR